MMNRGPNVRFFSGPDCSFLFAQFAFSFFLLFVRSVALTSDPNRAKRPQINKELTTRTEHSEPEKKATLSPRPVDDMHNSEYFTCSYKI